MDNVYLLPFKHKFLQQLQEMHALRDNALNCELTMSDLPKIGYIAFLGKQAVAAGFLRRVEPNYAQLDTFLSSPHFGSLVRHQALSLLMSELIGTAKDLNLKGIFAITKDESMVRRAVDSGFYVTEYALLAKRL